MMLFSATLLGLSLDSAIDLPGWSHCGEIGKTRVCWYPFEEYSRKIYFAAKNRSTAAKQCERLCLNIRDLDSGSTMHKSLIPSNVWKLV